MGGYAAGLQGHEAVTILEVHTGDAAELAHLATDAGPVLEVRHGPNDRKAAQGDLRTTTSNPHERLAFESWKTHRTQTVRDLVVLLQDNNIGCCAMRLF